MQELLLFGQVPLARRDYVLSVLAGIAAMQPKPILEKHLVFKPNRPLASVRASSAIARQGVSTSQLQTFQALGDLFYLTVVIDVNGLMRSGAGAANIAVDRNRYLNNANPQIPNTDYIGSTSCKSRKSAEEWTLQFRDVPEVNGRTVTSRQMFDLDFKSGDALAFMSALGYSQTSCRFISGHSLSHLSTSLLLYHPLANNSIAPSPGSGLFPEYALSPPNSWPLDPSEPYILQASLIVQDVNKPELVTRGVNELMALKETLRGVVDINVGDRLSLDKRVK